MGFIDIHAHILPELDDGAQSMEESIAMVRAAAESGVEAMIATPHSNLTGLYENYRSGALTDALEALRQRVRAEQLPVEILSGMEIYATEDLPALLRQNRFLTLHSSRYLLLEFDFHESPVWCTQLLEQVCDLGYIPIIAHPERYYAVWKEPWCVYPWLDMGCHLQLTRGSILGRFGREPLRASAFLLQHNLVACVASDAHGSRRRTPVLRDVHAFLTDQFSADYADMLLIDNPKKICGDQPLIE